MNHRSFSLLDMLQDTVDSLTYDYNAQGLLDSALIRRHWAGVAFVRLAVEFEKAIETLITMVRFPM